MRPYGTVESFPKEFNIENLAEYTSFFYESIENLRNDNARSVVYWTLRLMMESPKSLQYRKRPLGYINTAFGFFKRTDGEQDFGVIVYADSKFYLLNIILNFIDRYFKFLPRFHDYIYADNIQFSVVTRHIKTIFHSKNDNPDGGTTTCYVKPRKRHKYKGGLLTASHVVGYKFKDDINLSCGCPGNVVELGHCMEAAVITSKCLNVIDAEYFKTKIYPLKIVTGEFKIWFVGSNNKKVVTKIRHVTDTLGLYYSYITPIIIYLNDYGLPGDSGAMIEDERKNPIGIYIGKYKIKETGETGGLAQHLYQAAEIMNLDLYK